MDEWRQVVDLLPLARRGNRSLLAIADGYVGSVAVLCTQRGEGSCSS